MGLSPLARGNPTRLRISQAGVGSIPARTGEPESLGCPCCRFGVYPRSHGGTWICNLPTLYPGGLSPLARGNRNASNAFLASCGSIPARTGEP